MTLLLSRRDLDLLLCDWLDAESLLTGPRFAEHSRETFDAVLDLAAEVAAEHFAPHNKRADAEEPTFDGERVHMIPEVRKALDVLAQTGLIASSTELPHVVSTAYARTRTQGRPTSARDPAAPPVPPPATAPRSRDGSRPVLTPLRQEAVVTFHR